MFVVLIKGGRIAQVRGPLSMAKESVFAEWKCSLWVITQSH